MDDAYFPDELRRRRLARGWGQVKLAMRLRAVAEARDLGPVPIDGNTVSRWERGVQWPDPFYQGLICGALAVAPGELGLTTRAPARRHPGPDRSDHSPTPEVFLDRRRPITADVLVEAKAVSDRMCQYYDTLPPYRLLPMVRAHVRRLRATRHGSSRARSAELRSMAGEAAVMAGSLAYRLHNFAEAESFYGTALGEADEIGDSDLRALALTARSALYSNIDSGRAAGRPGLALAMLDAAEAAGGRRCAPLLRSWLLARRAAEHAAGGNAQAAFRDLERAGRSAASADQARGFFTGWNDRYLGGYRGCCAVLLGGPGAVSILEEAAAHVSPDSICQRSAVLIDLATAYARGRRPDDSCILLLDTLEVARHAYLPEVVRRITTVRRFDLDYWRRLPAVRRLDEQLRFVRLSTPVGL